MKKRFKNQIKKIRSYVLFSFGLVLFFSACEKFVLNISGSKETVNKQIKPFSGITIYDILDVELKSDSIYSLELFGYPEYVNNISFDIDSGVLNISDNNKFKWLADYPRIKITISFPAIEKILFKAPVNLFSLDTLRLEKLVLIYLGRTTETSLTINVNSLELWTSSVDFGYYLFKGKTKSCILWHQGNSIVDAKELESETCNLYNYSIGNSYVNVSNKLEVHLFSNGNVYYRGNPKEIIIAEQVKNGRLLKLTN